MGGAGGDCFLRATIVQEDGTVVESDAAYVLNDEDPERYGLIPDFGQTLTHDLRIAWPANLPAGTYALNDENMVGFIVITLDHATGLDVGGAWPDGTVTFSSLPPQLSGTAALEPREPIGNPLYPTEIRDVEFGCP